MKLKILFLFFLWIPFLYSDSVSFSVVGDIMNHDLQIQTAYDSNCDCWNYEFSFEKIKPYIEKVDIAIGNLETTFPGVRSEFSGYPQFGAPDELLNALIWTGFDILTLANNHSLDKGKNGIIRTRSLVESKGLIPLGTFYNRKHHEEHSVVFFKKNSIQFAFLNFTYGTNGIPVPNPIKINEVDLNTLRENIKKARSYNPDVIVLLLHYGSEYITVPDSYQKYIVKMALMEGVDIILGGHPHVLQPIELLNITDKYGNTKERLIVWSLGNFISNQKKINTDGGMIVQFRITRDANKIAIRDIDYIPVYVDFNKKHYILPIHEYIYVSHKKEQNKKLYGILRWNNQKYYIYFKDENVLKKNRMVLFFKNTIKILNKFPQKIEIRSDL